ncbi:sterol desaturase family protein [Patulibacter sp. NPDC049589]|uniref:sterol desaturase family protein n=1 Tax=Patulibacter sp. NPDC049589 TaxID=3154731 RepID=UPI00343043E2
MSDPILYAIPFFLLFMALEVLTLRHAAHEHAEDPSAPVGYDARDSATSITMGLGSLGFKAILKLGAVVVFAGVYELSPLKMPMGEWWPWLLLLFAEDLSFYAYHRGHHRVRMLWATHVVHHSSQHYNLSTALRQDWSPFTAPVFWLWLAVIGFPPWAILLAQSWNLLYQFLLHTEAVRTLPRPIELVMNTPSHHRVHHGVQDQYLDKNYGGIFIVWDRLFRTFEPERERVRYGLTTNIDTHNPVRVAYGEWVALLRDVRDARTWRDRAGYLFRGPGWSPAPGAAEEVREEAPAPERRRLGARPTG